MGFNVGIYCEPEIWKEEELQNILYDIDGAWEGATVMGKAGFSFFLEYNIYNEGSVLFQLCDIFELEFYKYLESFIYFDGDVEETNEPIIWHEIVNFSRDLKLFIDTISRIDQVKSSEVNLSKCLDYSIDNFYSYYSKNLVSELEKSLRLVKIYELFGASKVTFGYL